jgi:hypothetical protein
VIAFDLDGAPVLPGASRKTLLDFDTADGVLPASLTLGSAGADAGSSITFAARGTTYGAATITTAAANGSTATLTGPSLTLSIYKAVRIRVERVSFSAQAVLPRLALSSGTAGCQLYHAHNQTRASLASYAAGTTDTFIEYAWNGNYIANEYQRRRDLSLVITPADSMIYVLQGDQVWWKTKRTGMGLTAVTPKLVVQNAGTAAVSGDFRRLVVETWAD